MEETKLDGVQNGGGNVQSEIPDDISDSCMETDVHSENSQSDQIIDPIIRDRKVMFGFIHFPNQKFSLQIVLPFDFRYFEMTRYDEKM